MPCVSAYPPEKSHAIRLDEVSIKSEKRCNSTDQNSKLEAVAGELHAKLVVDSGMRGVGLDVRPGCGARGRWRGLAGLQADAQSCRTAILPHWCGGRRRVRRAWSRCRWVAAGPGRASRSTTPSRQARVWRSRGRAAAHRHTERPDRTRQIMRSGRRARRAKLAARTVSGRAAAHGHTKQPGLTRQKILQPEVWQLVQRLNSAQDAQQLEPQQINEKHQPSHQHSQLHSNTPKSHMRNMRAS